MSAAPVAADEPDMSRYASVAQHPFDHLRRGVALRLYAAAVTFSCIATAALTAIQLYGDHRSSTALVRTAVRLFASHGAGTFSAAFFVACMADRVMMRYLRAIARAAGRDSAAIHLGLSQVSEHTEAEEKLRASQASLANAQRLAGIGDWRWDAEKGVTHWSEELGVIVGFAPQDSRCTYARYLEIVHPDDRAAVRRALRRVITRRNAQAVDHRIASSAGEERIVQLKVEVAAPGWRPGGLVGTIQDVTERKRIERELLESREKLREFGAYMEATREDERKRIALEIHDELGQLLTALKMDVSLLKMRLSAPDLLSKVAEMLYLVDQTIWMVRNVANHLRPAALNFGLASALEWLAADFARRNGIPCQFCMNGCEQELAEAHATAVFRVAQESLTNVARHAKATRVYVTLTYGERGFDLHVADNGCGFDPAATSNGYSYGLLSMSERSRLIGTSLRIDSASGTGTVVSVSVPLACYRNTS